MQFSSLWPKISVISRTLVGGILSLSRDAVGVFYSSSRLGNLWPLALSHKYIYIYILTISHKYICTKFKKKKNFVQVKQTCFLSWDIYIQSKHYYMLFICKIYILWEWNPVIFQFWFLDGCHLSIFCLSTLHKFISEWYSIKIFKKKS